MVEVMKEAAYDGIKQGSNPCEIKCRQKAMRRDDVCYHI